jgi:hypothetical protein
VEFAEKLVRTCVLWEGSLALHNSRGTKEPSQDKTQGVKVKIESMEVDRDDLFDGDLCMYAAGLSYPQETLRWPYAQHLLQMHLYTALHHP